MTTAPQKQIGAFAKHSSVAAFVTIALFGGFEASALAEKPAKQSLQSTESSKQDLIDKARVHFERGVELSEKDNCEAAIVEFNASFKIFARPNTLYNLGICHERLFQYDAALARYEQYLNIALTTDPDYQTVSDLVEKLRNLLGKLEVITPRPAEVWLGNRKLGNSPGVFTVPAGRHVVEIRREGFHTHHRATEIVSGETTSVRTTLLSATSVRVEKQERSGISPWFFWSGLAATAVAGGVGTYFGLRSLELADQGKQIDSRLEENQVALGDKASAVDESALIADVFFITAGVLGAATLVSAFITDWGGDDDKKDGPSTRKEKQKPKRQAMGSTLRLQLSGVRQGHGMYAAIRGDL